jgi:hypothetical protein
VVDAELFNRVLKVFAQSEVMKRNGAKRINSCPWSLRCA